MYNECEVCHREAERTFDYPGESMYLCGEHYRQAVVVDRRNLTSYITLGSSKAEEIAREDEAGE